MCIINGIRIRFGISTCLSICIIIGINIRITIGIALGPATRRIVGLSVGIGTGISSGVSSGIMLCISQGSSADQAWRVARQSEVCPRLGRRTQSPC